MLQSMLLKPEKKSQENKFDRKNKISTNLFEIWQQRRRVVEWLPIKKGLANRFNNQ
jgi:hypothetical protein